MLHWLAGAKVQEVADAGSTTGNAEPPETPAPVFAVRAFKHALFGTPATVQAKAPRRLSNTENGKPRPNARPSMVRPRSTNDAQTIGRVEDVIDAEPLVSPTKGILMTPGTAAARRKNVSFGDGVVDNEGKRAGKSKSGIPDDCPGKFPSPFVKSTADEPLSSEKPRGRSKLTAALEQARDESAKRKTGTPIRTNIAKEEADIMQDLSDSHSDSEQRNIKLEYEQYREKTERELRKLVKKQQMAKTFAREKDMKCTEMEDELRQEQEKTKRLENLNAELQDQLKQLKEQLQTANAEKETAVEELVRSKSAFGTSGYRRAEKPEPEVLRSRRARDKVEEPQKDALGDNNTSNETPPGPTPAPGRRPRLQDLQTRTTADSKVPSPPTSSTLSRAKPVPSPTSPKPTRSTPPVLPSNALGALSINTLPQDTLSVALSMGLQPPSPERETRADSPLRSPKIKDHPLPPPPKDADKDDCVKFEFPTIPDSSPSTWERPNILTGSPVPVRPLAMRPARRSPPTVAKENISPATAIKVSKRSDGTGQEDEFKPSAAWARISAPAVERAKLAAVTLTAVEVKGEDKAREERMAIARAKIMARTGARQVSG
ncbi:unnamed protein product [Zymoseptoria tritici ST99CH_1A5]|uniref:Spindle pole body-associated protein cut12 domain-containing protein n=1 Tax=Zymoseptoria tritici ST99CH_1A5 TaxID=1276529 RepID=A0A1Y6LU96_ZYMTR|nr:unnamed protein product [Zymoseptoria tritici ST99CH_1A5]